MFDALTLPLGCPPSAGGAAAGVRAAARGAEQPAAGGRDRRALRAVRGPPARLTAGRYTVRPPMPKMKSHSGAKKRFKKTATGKLKARPRVLEPHPREEVAEAQARAGPGEVVAKADRKTVNKLLGGNGR